MKPATVVRGDSPLILSQPHSGTFVPEAIWERLNAIGRTLIDTDWHIPTLYDGLAPDATIVRANFSRYVIDVNRDPEGGALYPGAATTALAPMTTFDGDGIWTSPPAAEDIERRLAHYHRPFHEALTDEVARVRARNGVAILFDCHSIRSEIPRLFDGRLPDFNIGTNDTKSCSAALEDAVRLRCVAADGLTCVVNGRFKGGWITRHYGRPDDRVHAIQMELAQRTYLETEAAPFAYDGAKAERVREILRSILSALVPLATAL